MRQRARVDRGGQSGRNRARIVTGTVIIGIRRPTNCYGDRACVRGGGGILSTRESTRSRTGGERRAEKIAGSVRSSGRRSETVIAHRSCGPGCENNLRTGPSRRRAGRIRGRGAVIVKGARKFP